MSHPLEGYEVKNTKDLLEVIKQYLGLVKLEIPPEEVRDFDNLLKIAHAIGLKVTLEKPQK